MKKIFIILITLVILTSCANPNASIYDYLTENDNISEEKVEKEVWKYTYIFGDNTKETFVVEKENGRVIYKNHDIYSRNARISSLGITDHFRFEVHAYEDIPYISYTIGTTNRSGDYIQDPNTYIKYLEKE